MFGGVDSVCLEIGPLGIATRNIFRFRLFGISTCAERSIIGLAKDKDYDDDRGKASNDSADDEYDNDCDKDKTVVMVVVVVYITWPSVWLFIYLSNVRTVVKAAYKSELFILRYPAYW